MIVFELGPAGELYVHADERGLADLRSQLTLLRDELGRDHVQLMTPIAGGWELSEEPQTEGGRPIHHVLIRLLRRDSSAPSV